MAPYPRKLGFSKNCNATIIIIVKKIIKKKQPTAFFYKPSCFNMQSIAIGPVSNL
jgi:hypothetical protein